MAPHGPVRKFPQYTFRRTVHQNSLWTGFYLAVYTPTHEPSTVLGEYEGLISLGQIGFGEGNGNPLQYSCLENPMDRGAWQATVHEVTKSQTRLSDFTFTHWRRKWQPTPVFLPGESQGWWSLVGCHLWGHTKSDTTKTSQQQQQIGLPLNQWAGAVMK